MDGYLHREQIGYGQAWRLWPHSYDEVPTEPFADGLMGQRQVAGARAFGGPSCWWVMLEAFSGSWSGAAAVHPVVGQCL